MSLTLLRTVPLLAAMSDAELESLLGHHEWLWFEPGETVVRQGQPAGDFYMLVRGQVEVLLEGETRLGLLGPGDFFGEQSALTGEPAPATVVARELTSLLRLSPDGLLQLLERNGQLARQIIAGLAGRVQEAGARLHRARQRERSLSHHLSREGARNYSEWVGSGAWSQRVRAAIARGGRTLEPVVFVGEPGTGKELAAARMHYNSQRKEGPLIPVDGAVWSEERWAEAVRMAAHGTLLVKNAHLLTPAGVGCMCELLPSRAGRGRGDVRNRIPRIMVTAPSPEEREPSAAEEAVLAEGFAVLIPPLRERREDVPALVRHLLKKHGHRPEGEAAVRPISAEALRKLEAYPFLAGNVRELEQVVQQAVVLARGGVIQVEHLRLSGRTWRAGRPRVGLALGGGVVRGCAHIGVLRALQEAGIPVDFLAGTSSGSLVGALYAGGMDWSNMLTLLGTTGWFDIAEPCWPRGGFLTSRRMRAFIERQIGQADFGGLRIPFATVAGDANTGREVILREGAVAEAVRASTAIPGIFRPVELDGRLLVDGVVVNNVPASVVRSMGADLVIAIDITQYGFTAGAPRSLPEATMRAFDIMARQTIAASLEWADLVIRPQLGGLNGFSFKSAPEYVQRGYAAGREAVPEIQARLEEMRREFT